MSYLPFRMFSPLAACIAGVCCMSILSAEFSTLPTEQVDTMTQNVKEDPIVSIKTNKGEILVRLYGDKAPKTVENFRRYVAEGFYNGTIFHRVIDGFMIQGGGFTANMEQKQTHAPVMSEANKDVPNKRGTIAMARTNDPHSATSQFFINVTDNAFLNRKSVTGQPDGYTVFGEVTKGMDVIDTIRKVQTTDKAGHQNVPVEPVIIESIMEVKE